MVSCFVPDCNHSEKSPSGCKFKRFPSDQRKLKAWITLIQRKDRQPRENDRVCSCHFRNPKDINSKPTLFNRHETGKKFNFVSPEKRRKVRSDDPDAWETEQKFSCDVECQTEVKLSCDAACQTEHEFGRTYYEMQIYLLEKQVEEH